MLAAIRANLLASALGLLAAILLAVCLYQNVQIHGFLWIDGLNDKIENLQRDNNELRAGAKEAKRLNDEQVKRITNEQERISDEVERDLTARLERLRSELRGKSEAPRSAAGGSSPGPADPGSPRVDGEAGVCLTSEELLSAAESEERHDQLITLVEKLMGIQR